MYALCSSSGALADLPDDIAFFEEVRVWMARFDAEERRARGETVPPDVELYLQAADRRARSRPAGSPTSTRPPASAARTCRTWTTRSSSGCSEQRNPHLAIEALRRLIEQEMRKVTKHNIVKQTVLLRAAR